MSKVIQTVEELEAVLHWRRKHAQVARALDAAKAREDALQQRLTAADERADVSDNLLLAWYEANAKGIITVDDAAYHIVAATAEALEGGAASSNADLDQVKDMAERLDVLEGLLLEWRNGFGMTLRACANLRDRTDAALKPAEGGGSTCNQIREESGLPINRPCKACGVGACIDR